MQDGCWRIIDVETMSIVDEIHDLNDSISVIQFSPSGASLAVGTRSGIIHLYQVSNDFRKYNRIGRCTVSQKTNYWPSLRPKSWSDIIFAVWFQEDNKKQRSSSTGSPVNFVVRILFCCNDILLCFILWYIFLHFFIESIPFGTCFGLVRW